jgi:hypothetical protein
MKKKWARTVLSMAALAWGILPAGAQISPKQPRASGAASPPMQMRSITNQQRKAAAEELATRRTGPRTSNAANSNSSGDQSSTGPVSSGILPHQNSRHSVNSSNEGRPNQRPGNETR